MKIEFFSPEKIPTRLRLLVEDKYHVYYEKAKADRLGEFAWKFTFWDEAKECYEEILDAIVSTMMSQSYDHGASWRETSRRVVNAEDESWGSVEVVVCFRIRDAG